MRQSFCPAPTPGQGQSRGAGGIDTDPATLQRGPPSPLEGRQGETLNVMSEGPCTLNKPEVNTEPLAAVHAFPRVTHTVCPALERPPRSFTTYLQPTVCLSTLPLDRGPRAGGALLSAQRFLGAWPRTPMPQSFVVCRRVRN